jgi:hypothetical protein
MPSSAVLAHRRDDDAIGEQEAAHAERCEHGRRRRGALLSWVTRRGERPAREPLVHPRHERRIPHLEILVGDPQAARQQGERELDRLERHVALGVLEPLEAHLGRALRLSTAGRRAASYARASGAVCSRNAATRAIASSIASGARPHREVRRVLASPTSTLP